MSVREEFEAWWRNYRGWDDPYSGSAYDAYRAGALSMRERAAKACEEQWSIDGTHTANEFAAAIRALDVDADDLRSR